ncbi:MAG: ATP-binding protein [Rhodospirillaceae bacterium]|nr:ATP-binding protein [Rhodospirillales bacterium]
MSTDYRPDNFPMAIQGGMLEALGINMYTSIGKCLVEFVANAYDSDARTVGISIPEGIASARAAMREAAKKAVADGEKAPFRVLLEPLPDDFQIVITDDGHGMTPREVEDRFLPINRKRRADNTGSETNMKSESGRRYVMGRKGLGKLAGFGAAELVTIRTKRAGETFATVFKLDYNDLKNAQNLAAVLIPASYEEGQPSEEMGTSVVLSRLKCDAVKYSVDTVRSIISESFFGIDPADFEVIVNGDPCEEPQVYYEYFYPEHRGADGYASVQIDVDGGEAINFDYVVKFRAREPDPARPDAKYGNLDAAKRGARIYCNKRLAAGPSLFKLPTGTHGFHSHSYMECLVRADQLDRLTVDLAAIMHRADARPYGQSDNSPSGCAWA